MKPSLLAIALLALAQTCFAQLTTPARGRVDERKLVGVINNVQDEFTRHELPIILLTNTVNPILITNIWEGQYFITATNPGMADVTIGLPNPTNNYPRRFTFMGLGNAQFFLSNGNGGQLKIVSSNVVSPTVLIASNRSAVAWSTGTNWFVQP